jgi:cytosine/adenosine deaminase-related metal-dependent hydrolase
VSIALEGTLVRMLKARPKEVLDGRLYVTNDGRIAAARRKGASAPAGLQATPVVDVRDAFIYPGLIDLHSHLGYNALPLWTQPGEPQPFLHHDIWPARSTYKEKVSWPAWVLAKAAPEALLVYAQVQALAGGTTTIQGWPSANRRPANQLVRSADDQVFADEHGGQDNVRTSTLTLDLEELAEMADDLEAGLGFIYHCAEGQIDSRVVREFDDLGTANCLRQRLIAIHCSALDEPAFMKWRIRAELSGDAGPGAVVWSPFSNLWLYGQTTNVPAARKHGVSVCLGTDWGPSGTKNLLGELKVARLWVEHAGWDLDAFELVEMVTGSPGDMLSQCWGKQVGRLTTHARADVLVLQKTGDDPWEELVRAREEQVLLVLVDGQPRYGTKELMEACGASRTTSVAVGPVRRHIVLIDPKDADKPPGERSAWTWSKALDRLEAVRDDPIGAVEAADAPSALAGRIPSAVGPAKRPLLLELDMPGAPGMSAGPPPPGVRVDFEPIPSLRHDRNWRASVRGRGWHGGILDGLDRFYTS